MRRLATAINPRSQERGTVRPPPGLTPALCLQGLKRGDYHNDLWRFDLGDESWTCVYRYIRRCTDTRVAILQRLWAADESLNLATGQLHSDTDIRYADFYEFDPDNRQWTEHQSAGF